MSGITVAAPKDVEEMKAFVPVHRRSYLMSPDDANAWAEWVPFENFRIAKRNGKAIGGMTLVPMGQWFGGRSVPMTGISSVGISPEERATGGGTTFMKVVLEELLAAGVPISSLYPATQTIYRRCGYELAGDYIRYRVNTDEIDVRDRTLEVELTTERDAIVALYNERARRTAGNLDRTPHMWDRIFDPYKTDGADAYLVNGASGPEGYVTYTRESSASVRAHMNATLVALTPAAARRILTFAVDHKSFIETFNWTGPAAEPFTFFLAEPRRKVQMSWPWMLRIVDVRSALTERGYPSSVEAELDLRVIDDVLPSNGGNFVLRVSGGKADVQTGGKGSMKIDVRGLASLFTGYMSAHELLATGYIEATDAELARATSIFAGPAPWLADFF
jgi:predicted acetyltransferase